LRRFLGVPILNVVALDLISRVWIAKSLQRIATGEIFRRHRDQHPGPPSLLYTGERVYLPELLSVLDVGY